jgi:hypothetical protein
MVSSTKFVSVAIDAELPTDDDGAVARQLWWRVK